MLNNKIIFYGGMPRSGSHLLSGILNQNPVFHSEGSSALCRILWGVYECMNDPIVQTELQFFNRDSLEFKQQIHHSVINSYYEGIKNKIILEKNRSWTTKENMDLIYNAVDANSKFIVMTRDVEEIVKSFIRIHILSGDTQKQAEQTILNFNQKGTNPLMRPLAATVWAKVVNNNNFLFIDYKDILNNINNVLKNIYGFLELEYFAHDFNNIEMQYKENIWLADLSDVRKTISKQNYEINLSDLAKEKINYINTVLEFSKNPNKYLPEIEKFYYDNCY